VALVGVPVAALTFGASAFSSAQLSPDERATGSMGSADVVVTYFEPAHLTRGDFLAVWPLGTKAAVTTTGYVTIAAGSQAVLALTHETPAADEPPLRGRWAIIDGRAPRAPGEVALHRRFLERLDVVIGAVVDLGVADAVVTGIVADPLAVSAPLAIVGEGTLSREWKDGRPTVYIDLPSSMDPQNVFDRVRRMDRIVLEEESPRVSSAIRARDLNRSQVELRQSVGRDSRDAGGTAAAFALAGLALGATGLIAAAAFAVGTRRQLRTLGLVAAVGGTRGHTRSVVLLGGSVLGAVGGILGVGFGLGLLVAARPHLWRITGMLSPAFKVNLPAIFGAVGLAILAATGAAFLPARAAARRSPSLALAGVMPRPKPAGRLAGMGLGTFAAGVPVAILGARTDTVAPLLIGPALLIGGVLLAFPLLVGLMGKAASALPPSLRLAARDAARHGRRTSTALAAASMGLAIAVMIGVAAETNAADVRRRGPLGPQHLLISSFGATTEPHALVADLRDRFPSADVAAVRYAQVRSGGGLPRSVSFMVRAREGSRTFTQYHLGIATPPLLRAIGAGLAERHLRAGRAVLLGEGILEGDSLVPVTGGVALPAVELDLPSHSALPQVLVTPERARRLGYEIGNVSSVLFTDVDAVTIEEERAVAAIAARHGRAWVTSLRDRIPETKATIISLAVAGVLALLIVAVVLSLVAAESRRDRAILAAVGAAPLTRRKIAAGQAFLMVLAAGILAIPAGLAPYALWEAHSDLGGKAVTVSLPVITTVLFGIPMLAAGAAFVLTRRPRADAMVHPTA